jgi:DedD protein
MAFFKFRWPGQKAQDEGAKPARRSRNAHAESIDALRRRARHRLIGAAVLVLLGIIGFPMLFDTQPRPVAVDIPIEIPDRNKVAPLVVPEAAKAPAVVAEVKPQPSTQASGTVSGSNAAGLDAGEEIVSPRADAKPATAPVALPAPPVAPRAEAPARSRTETKVEKAETRSEPKAETRHESRAESKPAAAAAAPEPARQPSRADDAARARALLEGRPTASATHTAAPAVATSKSDEEGRFIVQVGAFADGDKAREVRSKLEHAGVKTYTQAVDTKDGKRTRVRAGPFANRAEADKAAGRIKALGLSATVLTL